LAQQLAHLHALQSADFHVSHLLITASPEVAVATKGGRLTSVGVEASVLPATLITFMYLYPDIAKSMPILF
jgi:hypothetical protein